LKGTAMSDSQTPRAEAIPAVDFSASYIETYKEGGTIADLAEKLERSIEQVRAKRQSLAAQVKLLGGEIPKLARMPRSGNGATGYIESAKMFADLANEEALIENVDESETEV
tara:strand:+ start:576 stop:911 length:336 start_codon:yes stop_codon:yes gene_type:complete